MSFVFCSFMMTSCLNVSKDSYVVDDTIDDAHFFSDNLADQEVNIYFFDVDNLNHGEETTRTAKSNAKINISSCDAYMVKIGDVEILVDCGYQIMFSGVSVKEQYPYTYIQPNIKENVDKNILPKIASICTDGILDYLIVTHADFDHIASLVVEGGIIDSFINNKTITNLDGNSVKLKGIKNVIDFNSGVVALHSYSEIDKEKRLCKSILYQTYLTKINELINRQTNYLPAAALFDENVRQGNTSISSMSIDNKLLATPEKMKEKVESKESILSEDNPNGAAKQYVNSVRKNSSYKDNVSKLGGELKAEKIKNEEEKDESYRYYYSIPLKANTELRILYNWYYDFAERHGFGGQTESHGFGGQDVNNPSVCLQVVQNEFKFMSCGDLGGNGESGILNYYKGTSILKDIKVFRASHHGSTNNSENSQNLFEEKNP